jgi:uncharacterized membrane protein
MSQTNAASAALPELTQDEKAFAGLAHALMMSTWWIGPLIIYLVRKESRFVKFHALQALFWQIIFTVLYVGGFAIFFGIMMANVLSTVQKNPQTPPNVPVGMFIFLPFFWLFAMGMFAATMTLGIMFCLKAMRGEWAGYPIIGGWARRIVLK